MESECNNADGQPPPPLLDSPLPTPRRLCTSIDALRMCCRRDASPLRTQSEANSDDDDDNRSFSDALDRNSSPERTGSFDRVTSKCFEDIFVGRTTSFAKDRTRHLGAEATDLSALGRRPRQPRRGSTRRSHDEDHDRRWTPRLLNDNVPMQLMRRIKMDADAEEMTPRACGLMVFFPWSAKPAVCDFRSPVAQHATTTTTPRARAELPSPSHSRTTTLRDVIKEDSQAVSSDMQQPRGEKRGRDRDDLPSRRWGVSSLLDTSKKYCTDARKALSKLSIGLGADGGSPRVSGENRSGKLHGGFSSTPATPVKLTQLKANRN
ncbi:unnamed protein product [Miscanthus lutarioriparius]|uniref:Uncharacterized protein n=1 Tax=Miscanthus lutarioriparius TaxID=422564 RepID=A0A811SIV7_9POAL|nr:unnamed protein product [Miscanthus lutarioriparius]